MTGSQWFGFKIAKEATRPPPEEGSFELQEIYRFSKRKTRNDSTDWQYYVYLRWNPLNGLELDRASYERCALEYDKWFKENNPAQLSELRDEMHLWQQRAQVAEAKLADANAELAKLKGAA